MEDGLAVAADEIDAGNSDAKFLAGLGGGVGKGHPEAEIELADFAGGAGGPFGDAQDFGADGGGNTDGGVVEKFGVGLGRFAGDFGEGDVDAVGGGAGH